MRLKLAISTDRTKLLCFLLAIIPILNGYSSGISSFSIGMCFFSLLSVYALIKTICFIHNGKQGIIIFPIYVAVLLILLTIAVWSHSTSITSSQSVLFSLIKRLIWGISIVCLPNVLKYWTLVNVFKRIAIVSTVYLIIQNVFFYILRIQLPNVFQIGFLKANYDYYTEFVSYVGTALYRPGSFFSEPAFYGYFVNLVIILLLFNNRDEEKDVKTALFLSFGIILSTSSGGLYVLLVLWMFFFLLNYRDNRVFSKFVIAIIIMLLLVFVLTIIGTNYSGFSGLGYFGEALNKAFSKIDTIATNSRLGGSFEKLDGLYGKNLVFGFGIGLTGDYLAGFSRGYVNGVVELILQSGIIGTIIFSLMCLYIFIKAQDSLSRVLMIVFILDGFYSGIYFSMFGMIYLCILNCRRRELYLNENYAKLVPNWIR